MIYDGVCHIRQMMVYNVCKIIFANIFRYIQWHIMCTYQSKWPLNSLLKHELHFLRLPLQRLNAGWKEKVVTQLSNICLAHGFCYCFCLVIIIIIVNAHVIVIVVSVIVFLLLLFVLLLLFLLLLHLHDCYSYCYCSNCCYLILIIILEKISYNGPLFIHHKTVTWRLTISIGTNYVANIYMVKFILIKLCSERMSLLLYSVKMSVC